MTEGLLISFEGVDGCGKSTQLARVAERLRAAGIEPVLVREPGGTHLGERVREVLLDPATGDIDAAAEALLYAASRAELVSRTIEPALAAGQVVLVDRYVDSSLAYQGAGRGLGIDRVLEANLLATRGRLPHRTVLVDVTLDVASERLAAEGAAPDRLEAAGGEFFTRVHAAYAALAARWPERIAAVDGAGTPDEVERQVDAALAPLLAERGITLAPLAPAPSLATEARA
ncbi:MAG: dTMP kinase [Thermoleophilia bacterium]|nr:dTMP kinase [Thermoleophilia bacterium]